MSAVWANHQAASWLSTCPLYGTPAMTRSKAERRSVVTNRRSPPQANEARTLPSRRSGRSSSTSMYGSGSTSALLGVAHAVLEQGQAAGRRRRLAPPPAAGGLGVLAGDDVVLRVGHQPEHEAGGVGHPGDVGDGSVRVVPGVAQGDLAALAQAVGVGMDVAPLPVGDRAGQLVEAGGPDAPRAGFRPQRHPLAVEPAVGVVPQRTGEQARTGEHLEAV